MSSRLCPYCMKTADSDTCPHCGKNIDYVGSPTQLPAGYVVSGKHPYVLGAVLGQGGFGITYIALDMVTQERVAIKEYFPTFCASRTSGSVSPYPNQEEIFLKGRRRFLDEAQVLKSLSDLQTIVNVLDFFEFNNSAYLVMEFLDGDSLKAHAAKHGKFPAQQFLAQIRPLMEDLEKMHQRGVIHRDIAPDNIILLPDGQMKLIDFGAARSFVGDRSMTVVVKKGFAPVEQYLSKGSTNATDVYALAATIYYCITGKVPVDSAQRQSEGIFLEAPTSLGADITPEQEIAIFKALEIQQKMRIQTIQQFEDALDKENMSSVSCHVSRYSLPKGYTLYSGFHPYELGSILTRDIGSFVYNAQDTVTGASVNIKEFFPAPIVTRNPHNFSVIASSNQKDSYDQCKELFLDDTWKLKRLNTLNHIVHVLDFFEANNTVYVVTEPLAGISLKDYVEKYNKFPAQEFLMLIQPLMKDLHKLHQRGILHQSINPNNIILLPNGQLKLTGFYDHYNSEFRNPAHSGPLSMSEIFIAWEQFKAHDSPDSRTDIYLLAATIYYCITGEVPTQSAVRLMDGQSLSSPASLGADISPMQEAALLKALELKKKNRPQSMQEFGDNLSGKVPIFQEKKLAELPPNTTMQTANQDEELSCPKPRKKILVILAAFTAVCILCANVFGFFKNSTAIYNPETIPTVQTTAIATTEETTETETADTTTAETNEEPVSPLPNANILKEDIVDLKDLGNGKYATRPVFGKNIMRNQIASITILNTKKNVPDEAWDVSQAGNRSVVAWIEENGTLYDLYIAGDGGVTAPNNCRTLFALYSKAKYINFNNSFSTANVTNMHDMFLQCQSLEELDLSGFDTSKTTNMRAMFHLCSGLLELDLYNFTTSKITDMGWMFADCLKLKQVFVSGFDTKLVKDMGCMFYNCRSLTKLDLNHFNTANVTAMHYMFYNCPNLDSLDISTWDTAQVVSYEYFMDANKQVNGHPWNDLFKK